MSNRLFTNFLTRPVISGLFVFVALLLLTQLLTYQRYLLRKDADRTEIATQAAWTKERLQTIVSYSFSSTQTLAFIIEKYGVPKDFDSVAKQLLNTNKYIDAVELVQGGVITNVYPLKDNEAVIGFNILLDSARKSGAIAAIQKKEFFISGPLNLKQGGAGFVSRTPIFKNNEFWGFSAALIKLSTLLEAAGIDTSGKTNFLYQLAKFDIATGQEDFFLSNRGSFKKEYSIPVEIPNGEWRLYVMAKKNTTFSGLLFFGLLGFILAVTGGLFAWFIVKQPLLLNQLVQEKTLLLQTSNERFQLISRATNDALWEWNFETGQLWGNETHQQLFGLTMADPVPHEDVWKEHIHPDDRAAIAEKQAASLLSDKAVFISEYRFRLPNNEYCFIYDRCYILRNKQGQPLRMVGSMMNITEQKNAAHSLKEREEHLFTILQTDPECIKQLGPAGEVYDMNPAGLAMIEADSLDMIKNISLTQILLPRYKPLFAALSKDVFNGKSGRLEFEIEGFKGTHRYLEMHAVPLRNAEGSIISLLGVTRDITQHKKAEEQIIKEKELSDSIINSLPGIFYLFDANRKLLRWNKNFESVTGYDAKEIVAVKPIDFYEGEGRQMVQENFTRVMMEGKSQFEANFVTKNGDKIPYFFTGLLVEYEGHPCLLGTGIDITLRKNAEQEIEMMNEQLRQLTRHLQNIREEERKRIAREIHDDLGQQLTAIKMGVVWINKKIPDDATDVKNRLNNIISMLDSSNVSVRKILNELRTDILDNYGLIEALQWQGQQFTATTDIPLLFDSPEEIVKAEEPVVTCIFRIFQEALTNITKYAHATQVTSSLTCTSNHIIFTIADNGTGFDTELLKSKKSFGILGMRERVAALNGSFSLESAPGKGTSITICIPL